MKFLLCYIPQVGIAAAESLAALRQSFLQTDSMHSANEAYGSMQWHGVIARAVDVGNLLAVLHRLAPLFC